MTNEQRLAAAGITGPGAIEAAKALAPEVYAQCVADTDRPPTTTYALIDAVNISTLKSMAVSPRHYQHALATPRTDSDSMALGRLMHAMIFEPDAIDGRYAVWDGGRRAGKEWTAFLEANAGKEILRAPEDWERSEAVRDAVLAHPVAAELLREGQAERVMQWTDAETGIACKGRADWITGRTIVDLKTTRAIGAREIQRQLVSLAYHAQAAFYCDGREAMTGVAHDFAWIYVEQLPPHDVAVYRCPGDVYRAGQALYRAWLRRVVECRESGVWPGTAPTMQEMELPAWASVADGLALTMNGEEFSL
jgi:hypothetical protein